MHYQLAVFIGRFQPLHVGQKHVIDRALQTADRVLLLLGSAFEPRSIRNPFLYAEREAMIRACFTPDENKRIICKPQRDIRYNDTLWITQIQRAVFEIMGEDQSDVTLIGRQHQGMGYYTSLFPQWASTAVVHEDDVSGLDVRHALFNARSVKSIQDDVPAPLLPLLENFIASDAGQNLCQEFDFIESYKKGWANAPFAPTHVTVDAVVVQSGHVLLVERGAQPGKGLWALPGGFIDHQETLLDAMVRKLKEETKLKVPVPVIYGSVRGQSVFDAPFRSVRGRTITHAFYVELRDEPELPKIKGGGETNRCFWLPLGQLDSTKMFEDHYFIIQKMIA